MLPHARPAAWLLLGAALLLAPDALAKKPKKHAVRSLQPPIAYYLAGEARGPTADEAIDACRAQRMARRQGDPGARDADPDRCAALVMAVRGPYTRKKAKGGDDPKVHVYRGKDGVWRAAGGETATNAPPRDP